VLPQKGKPESKLARRRSGSCVQQTRLQCRECVQATTPTGGTLWQACSCGHRRFTGCVHSSQRWRHSTVEAALSSSSRCGFISGVHILVCWSSFLGVAQTDAFRILPRLRVGERGGLERSSDFCCVCRVGTPCIAHTKCSRECRLLSSLILYSVVVNSACHSSSNVWQPLHMGQLEIMATYLTFLTINHFKERAEY
jgi:hypothetical protein